MTDFTLSSFGAIAATLFVAELTDKDAFFMIAMSAKLRARVVFFAGATAFTFTTLLFVTLGSVLVTIVPVYWVRLAGGLVMIAFGLWEARGFVGMGQVEEEESRVRKARSPWKAFLALVAALAILDIAGDATEVLTIVFAARYSNPILVFTGAYAGLISATASEAALGNRLGRFLTPGRLRVISALVFVVLGAGIILLDSA